MKHPRLLAVATGVAALVLLAGCAAPVGVHTLSPSHTESTPTPTPTSASAPGSRVPLGCGALLGSASITAIAGKAAKLTHDENSALTTIESVAQAQYGSLACAWFQQGTPTTGAELEVNVAPDAAAPFASSFPAIMADQSLSKHPAASEGVAGDQSGFWCADNVDALGSDFNLPICDGELLVSGYWVSLQIDTVNGLTRAQLVAALPAAMTDIAARLKPAGSPSLQWRAPASTPTTFCSTNNTAAVRAVFGNSNWMFGAGPTVPKGASSVGLAGHYAACRWDTPSTSGVYFFLLAGGAWAMDSIKPTPSGDSVIEPNYGTLAVPGASKTLEACGEDECDAYLAVGTTLVEVQFNDPGAARRASVLGALATIIAAS